MSSAIIDATELEKIQSIYYINKALVQIKSLLQIVKNEQNRLEKTIDSIDIK